MTIVERIREKGQVYNMTIASIEKATGISNGTISKWNERKPSADNLYRVAKLLNVSMEYLISGETADNDLSPEEEKWLNLYKQLSSGNPDVKSNVLDSLKDILQEIIQFI